MLNVTLLRLSEQFNEIGLAPIHHGLNITLMKHLKVVPSFQFVGDFSEILVRIFLVVYSRFEEGAIDMKLIMVMARTQ